jgi:hypothetical protein
VALFLCFPSLRQVFGVKTHNKGQDDMKLLKHSDLEQYGFTPTAIAKICKVSTRTAQRWIAGHTKAPHSAIQLLKNHATGRTMPTKWPHYWRFNELGYLDMGHTRALGWQQIDWYFYSVKCWFQLLDMVPRLEARIDALMKISPTAVVIDLQRYKDELQALKNRPFVMPENLREYYEIEPRQLHRQSGC